MIVDLPPGTADLQQQPRRALPDLAGAIIVVGPQDAAHLDAHLAAICRAASPASRTSAPRKLDFDRVPTAATRAASFTGAKFVPANCVSAVLRSYGVAWGGRVPFPNGAAAQRRVAVSVQEACLQEPRVGECRLGLEGRPDRGRSSSGYPCSRHGSLSQFRVRRFVGVDVGMKDHVERRFSVVFTLMSVLGSFACGVLRPQPRWSKRTTR